VAQRLAAEADLVAATPGCAGRDAAVRLRRDVVAAISRVPSRYQEPLMSAANDLVERIRACAPGREDDRAKDHGRDKHGKHAKRHGRGKDD
jgi:hypothetical protein